MTVRRAFLVVIAITVGPLWAAPASAQDRLIFSGRDVGAIGQDSDLDDRMRPGHLAQIPTPRSAVCRPAPTTCGCAA